MADSSFDIVSKVDPMEVQNALGQAQKEIQQRYDFKGVDASIEMSGEKILLKANAEERVKAVLEVFEQKLIKRSISLRSLDAGKPFASGKEYRIEAAIKEGISSEDAKKIAKIIRDEGPKSIKSQIQGDELRVQSKSPRRPSADDRAAQGQRPRRRAAVHQLPLGVSIRAAARRYSTRGVGSAPGIHQSVNSAARPSGANSITHRLS